MAAALPLSLYIAAGSFAVRLDGLAAAAAADADLQQACARVWQADGWLLAQTADRTGTDVDGHGRLPAAFQRWLLQQPGFVHVTRLWARQWVRFAFRALADTGGGGGEQLRRRGVCRVYVLPDDAGRRLVPRDDAALRRDRQRLLSGLDYGGEGGGEEEKKTPGFPSPSLLHLFNTMPSPQPQWGLFADAAYRRVVDDLAAGRTRGLAARLHAYQVRSVAVMLQRELHPGRVVDPRLRRMGGPEAGAEADAAWYYDDVTGEVLRTPRLYDGVCGGILAEEMGTGKTLMCLALVLATRAFPAAMPEEVGVEGGGVPVRPRVASLADMAAATLTRRSVPWRLYLEGEEGLDGEYQNCVDVLRRNPATYTRLRAPPAGRARETTGSTTDDSIPPVTLSCCSLVLVPANLVRQWEQEVAKHTTGLRVLVVAGKDAAVPSAAAILDADVLLFSTARFERLVHDRVPIRGGSGGSGGFVLRSPLAAVHFKRVVVDEGHRLGSARLGRKSNLLLVLDCLAVSARWLVTGTPSTGLYGVERPLGEEGAQGEEAGQEEEEADADHGRAVQERKDLERLGAMARLYLRVRPWANTAGEAGGDGPADWAVYVGGRRRAGPQWQHHNTLRAALAGLLVRHRAADMAGLLPPVVEREVVLDGCAQDALCRDLFAMMIVCNAVQSQRRDQDYFFHPRQRPALLQLLRNMRQAAFYGAYFFSAADIAAALATADAFLAAPPASVGVVAADDQRRLRAALALGRAALRSRLKRLASRVHEVPLCVRDLPGGGAAAAAWSLDEEGHGQETQGRLTLTAAPLVLALQQLLRPCADAPHALALLLASGRYAQTGRDTLQQHLADGKPSSHAHPPPPPPRTLAGNTGLGEGGPAVRLKRRTQDVEDVDRAASESSGRWGGPAAAGDAVASALAKTQLLATASAKLSYLLDAILQHQADEQMLVFYDSENVAFYLAEHLELLQVPHLIYARGITAERRAQYVAAFNGGAGAGGGHVSPFRVLLMDLSQAAFGLDMWAASRVYFVGPVLNPQVAAQAVGRVRRISQPRPVVVETLVLRGSVDEVIAAAAARRRRARAPAEHPRRLKTPLDDRAVYDWVANVQVLWAEDGPGPRDDHDDDGDDILAQMAPLASPASLFGRGFGRVPHPDEGLAPADRPAWPAKKPRTAGVRFA